MFKNEQKQERKNMKKTLAFLLSLGLTVSMLAGCGSKTNETTAATDAQTESAAGTEKSTADDDAAATTTSDKTYKIGVLQYVQHDALDASNEGFFAALDDLGIKYDADQQNAAGEASSCQTISETLVNDGDRNTGSTVRSRCYLRYSNPADSRNRSGRIRSGRVKRCTGRKCNWYF